MSRSTKPSPFGKRTEKLSRPHVSTATKALLTEKWRALGYRTESEYLSELVEASTHGLNTVLRLHEERLKKLLGIGQE